MTRATPTKDHEEEREVVKEDSADDNEEGYDGDEEEDEEDDSFWTDFVSSWRQHLFAITIAIVAAVLGCNHFESTSDAIHAWSEYAGTSHEHIHVHERIAKLSFCDKLKLPSTPELTSFEFQVPKDLISAMEHHYRVDSVREEIKKSDGFVALLEAASNVELSHPEFHCLQQASTPKPFVPGQSFGHETPSIQSIVNTTNKVLPASLSFTGFAAKFFNLSPKPLLLHWDGKGGHANSARLVAEISPMESVGTATTPGQSFYISPVYDSSHALQRWVLTADMALVVYEDVGDVQKLSQELRVKYDLQKLNLQYANDYLVATGRTWLANFPRPPPMHFLWPTNHLGQTHQVSTSVGHYVGGQERVESLDLTLTVSSVAPRVLTIDNFLSKWECEHLIHLAKEQGLRQSTVVSSTRDTAAEDKATRSSTNAWLERHHDFVLDDLYRRAADVLGLDDSLMQHRSEDYLELSTHHSISESMQIVHYAKNQEYTPHHDFTYPPVADRYQATRFATLLLYLNEPTNGGETTFPRSIQATNHDGLVVQPELGKAVLFYHVLPDGNMDDLSQHSSKPVLKGEKWVANLWVWDPVIG